MTETKQRLLTFGFFSGILSWFLWSRLGFSPVPWPDGPSFYLAGVDWIHIPSHYRMQNMVDFVPSYGLANFNTMPALPFIFGMGEQLGISKLVGATLGIRLISLIPLMAFAWLIWNWLRPKVSLYAAAFVAAAALFDPVCRWGTQVVRPEMWIGLIWLLIVIVLTKADEKPLSSKALWKVSGLLALSACCHFEAVILVPAVVVGLCSGIFDSSEGFKAAVKRILTVGFRTVIWLSPWLIYVALHFSSFKDQMQIQFGRLAHDDLMQFSTYQIFHGLFHSHGSPAGWPKFFNIAKGIFWFLSIALTLHTCLVKRNALRFAAGAAYATSLYLYFTKPEVWFITLCHLTLWSWLMLTIAERPRLFFRTWAWITATFAALALGATIAQQQDIPKEYTWKNYTVWADCIEKAIGGGTKKVWQPYLPDVLVELSHRNPKFELTRAMDFRELGDLTWEFSKRLDVIVLSGHLRDLHGEYSGPERASDREWMKNGVEIPYGNWALDRFPKEQPGEWENHICQNGPFWAGVLLRVRPHQLIPNPSVGAPHG